ncbi:MAG: helix-turn-helix domain-containing protein [Lachnospiraceae bacterium]|nr:helix-turn-helix domain-containing protein [Lachnospiraceae bacterium]
MSLAETNCIHPASPFLREYDREYATNYLQTLRTYLRYMGKSAEICEMMRIHRNTLTYRINKIEHLTGIDLDNCCTCTLLSIGLMILDQ